MFSRHWICWLKWGASISACVSFGSLPNIFPIEIGFEITHGDHIGAAVPRLKHWAVLAIFWQNQNNAVYSALVFFLVLPDISNILSELECTHLCELFVRSFYELVVIKTLSLLLRLKCLSSSVFKFPVAVQKDSDRGKIRTHERKAYWIQRLDHLATLSLFFEKSQKLLSILLLSFS